VADTKGNYLDNLSGSNRIGIEFPVVVYDLGEIRFYDNTKVYFGYPWEITNQAWTLPDYPDTGETWGSRPGGVVYYDQAGLQTNGTCPGFWYSSPPLGIFIDPTADPDHGTTYYFRSHFTAPTNNGFGKLTIRYVSDDGIIWYLNGQEIFRTNMPPGSVTRTTQSNGELYPGCRVTGIITVTNLRNDPNTNVLAAEVHQSADATSQDLYYGVKLTLTITNRVPYLPRLSVAPTGPSQPCPPLQISWPASDYPEFILESTGSIPCPDNAWAPLTTTNTPPTNRSPHLLNSCRQPQEFFRLRGPAWWP
jgi:hypothetical protein